MFEVFNTSPTSSEYGCEALVTCLIARLLSGWRRYFSEAQRTSTGRKFPLDSAGAAAVCFGFPADETGMWRLTGAAEVLAADPTHIPQKQRSHPAVHGLSSAAFTSWKRIISF